MDSRLFGHFGFLKWGMGYLLYIWACMWSKNGEISLCDEWQWCLKPSLEVVIAITDYLMAEMKWEWWVEDGDMEVYDFGVLGCKIANLDVNTYVASNWTWWPWLEVHESVTSEGKSLENNHELWMRKEWVWCVELCVTCWKLCNV